ncbi:transposase family protein [Deinococcus saxicola]|uniref:transposase family protein n=1 Tax=Deinococcus saxicola TaxID=249406 RepID=UPI0039EFBF6B
MGDKGGVRTPISPLPFLTQIPYWRDPHRITYPWDALWALILTGLLSGPENILPLCSWLHTYREPLTQRLCLPGIPRQATLYRFFWNLDLAFELRVLGGQRPPKNRAKLWAAIFRQTWRGWI